MQNPGVLPAELLELSSFVVLHRFASPGPDVRGRHGIVASQPQPGPRSRLGPFSFACMHVLCAAGWFRFLQQALPLKDSMQEELSALPTGTCALYSPAARVNFPQQHKGRLGRYLYRALVRPRGTKDLGETVE